MGAALALALRLQYPDRGSGTVSAVSQFPDRSSRAQKKPFPAGTVPAREEKARASCRKPADMGDARRHECVFRPWGLRHLSLAD